MEINHEWTNEVVCPYCGYEFSDSYEFGDSDGDIECDECEKLFYFYPETTVTYSTQRDCKLNNREHQWKDQRLMNSGSTLQHCSHCDQIRFV